MYRYKCRYIHAYVICQKLFHFSFAAYPSFGHIVMFLHYSKFDNKKKNTRVDTPFIGGGTHLFRTHGVVLTAMVQVAVLFSLCSTWICTIRLQQQATRTTNFTEMSSRIDSRVIPIFMHN